MDSFNFRGFCPRPPCSDHILSAIILQHTHIGALCHRPPCHWREIRSHNELRIPLLPHPDCTRRNSAACRQAGCFRDFFCVPGTWIQVPRPSPGHSIELTSLFKITLVLRYTIRVIFEATLWHSWMFPAPQSASGKLWRSCLLVPESSSPSRNSSSELSWGVIGSWYCRILASCNGSGYINMASPSKCQASSDEYFKSSLRWVYLRFVIRFKCLELLPLIPQNKVVSD